MSVKELDATAPSAARRKAAGPRAATGGQFRGDIEGLRAVAVLLVMLSHAGIPFLPGGFVGVDAFFVISGFLITGLLLRELEINGRISLKDFYARRAKRILPAASVVLVATLAMTMAFLPRTRWESAGQDVLASALYVMNWDLAADSTDYAAVNAAPSITQQYWSLSVEEQFYLLWPVLFIAVGLLARRLRGPHRSWYLAGLALIGLPSLMWSVVISGQTPSAYYATTTRAWELALGGVVAVVSVSARRAPRPVAAVLAWLGLAAVLSSAVLIESVAGYPGWLALLPTVGVATTIAFGPAAGVTGPATILALRPMRMVGALSYSLYLWHWPVLVAAQAQLGDLGLVESLSAVAVAAVLAVLSYRFIENPIRVSPFLSTYPGAALRMGALATTTTALVALAFQLLVLPGAPAASAAPINRPGRTRARARGRAAGGRHARARAPGQLRRGRRRCGGVDRARPSLGHPGHPGERQSPELYGLRRQ